jgi:hypothetical protein
MTYMSVFIVPSQDLLSDNPLTAVLTRKAGNVGVLVDVDRLSLMMVGSGAPTPLAETRARKPRSLSPKRRPDDKLAPRRRRRYG